MTDARLSEMGIRLAAELRDALDDPKRYEWGDGPWEHLGDAEKDVRLLLATVDELVDERDALSEAQQFPVETVMSWKRRAEGAEAMNRYARLLLDPDRQDEPDEENALRAFEALSGIPLSQPANVVMPERTLELVLDIVDRGVCEGTTPAEALATIGHLIRKRHPRKQTAPDGVTEYDITGRDQA